MLLTFLLMGASVANAQVIIGDTDTPHPGAVLELKSLDRGLLLPGVKLDAKDRWTVDNNKPIGGNPIEGMMVFNTGGVLPKGMYVWIDGEWVGIAKIDGEFILVTGVSLDKTTLKFSSTAATQTLTATITPPNAINKGLTWTSSNNSIAKVSTAGVVTPVANGTCTITVTTNEGGYSAACAVTVANLPIPLKSIAIEGNSSLPVSDTQTLTASFTPANATNQNVVWLIESGKDYASINSSTGLLRGTAVGTVLVRVRSAENSLIYATQTVKITPYAEGLVTGANGTYTTYTYTYNDFTTATWMVENSKEGTAITQGYNNNASRVNGYFYTKDQMAGACPSGWTIPSSVQWNKLMEWVNANKTSKISAWWLKAGSNAFAGYSWYSDTDKKQNWEGWNNYAHWWTSTGGMYASSEGANYLRGPYGYTSSGGYYLSVRCVKN